MSQTTTRSLSDLLIRDWSSRDIPGLWLAATHPTSPPVWGHIPSFVKHKQVSAIYMCEVWPRKFLTQFSSPQWTLEWILSQFRLAAMLRANEARMHLIIFRILTNSESLIYDFIMSRSVAAAGIFHIPNPFATRFLKSWQTAHRAIYYLHLQSLLSSIFTHP